MGWMVTYLRAALYVAIIAVLGCLGALLLEARRTVAIYAGLPAIVDLAITRESWNIQRTAAQEIDKLRHTSQVELRLTREALAQESGAWRGMIDSRAKSVTEPAGLAINEIRELTAKTGQQVAGVTDPLSATLRDASRITANVAETTDVLLDCEGNPQCIQNRTIGTMQAVEKASQAVASAAPKVTEAVVTSTSNVAAITADAHALSTRLVRPKRWWEKLAGIVGTILGGASRAF